MHGNRIRVESRCRATHGIETDTDDPAGNNVSSHGCAAGRGKLAFNFDGLRVVTGFAHRDGETFFPAFHDLRWRNGFLAGGKFYLCSGGFARDV